MEPTNVQRAEALLHLVLRISAIRTDRDVSTDLMLSDLRIFGMSSVRAGSGTWIVRLDAQPDDGADVVGLYPSGSGDTFRAAMDDALADYADRLLRAVKVRTDWAEEEGEVAQ